MANQKKKGSEKKNTKNKMTWIIIGVAAICLVGVLLTVILTNNQSTSTQADKIEKNGYLSIPISDVTEKARFYSAQVDGTDMEVLAVKASDGSIRTAFNTCQSCYTSGNGRYETEGNELVCQNCGFHFTSDEVGVENGGGCNPWPITDKNRKLTEKEILISYDFLSNSKAIFANWSK